MWNNPHIMLWHIKKYIYIYIYIIINYPINFFHILELNKVGMYLYVHILRI